MPAATWLPIVASIKEKAVKNLAARESKLAMTAGMYHWKEPYLPPVVEVPIPVPIAPVPVCTNSTSYISKSKSLIVKGALSIVLEMHEVQ